MSEASDPSGDSRAPRADSAPSLTDAPGLTALLLIGVGREVERRVRAALAAKDLKPRQIYILDVLAQQGPVGQRELGALLDTDHSLLVTQLNPLETDGLIERRRSEEDRRRHQVLITAAGRRVLKQGLAIIDTSQAELLDTLDESEAQNLRALLQTVRGGFARDDAPTPYSTDKEDRSNEA